MHYTDFDFKELKQEFLSQITNCVNIGLKRAGKTEITSEDINFVHVKYPNAVYTGFDIYNGLALHQNLIARFYLTAMPGCCGVIVSHSAWVSFSYRGTGLGLLLNKIRQAIAKKGNYGVMICTDVDTNTPQKKILDKAGWSKAFDFINPKTGNKVNLHYIDLTKEQS